MKELFFFDQFWDRGKDWYESHWSGAPANYPRGEVSSTYYASSHAAQRLDSVLPGAEVVAILRD
ncbi:MAG: hypothetical protein WBG57_14590, partial [Ornithinimicrobium sp.]